MLVEIFCWVTLLVVPPDGRTTILVTLWCKKPEFMLMWTVSGV